MGKGKVTHPLLRKELERNHNAERKGGVCVYKNYQHSGRGAGGQGAEEIKGSWEDQVTTMTGDTHEQSLCSPGDARPFLQQNTRTTSAPTERLGLMEQEEELLVLRAVMGKWWLLPG